jgi:hypothetical protein
LQNRWNKLHKEKRGGQFAGTKSLLVPAYQKNAGSGTSLAKRI